MCSSCILYISNSKVRFTSIICIGFYLFLNYMRSVKTSHPTMHHFSENPYIQGRNYNWKLGWAKWIGLNFLTKAQIFFFPKPYIYECQFGIWQKNRRKSRSWIFVDWRISEELKEIMDFCGLELQEFKFF